MMRIGLVALPLVLAGCAAHVEPPVTEAKKEVCAREYRVGSNIPVTTCSTALSESDRQRVLEELHKAIRPSVAGKSGAGG